MHLLSAAQAPAATDEAVDLGQTPGRIVVATCADSEIACLAAAQRRRGHDAASLRLANLLRLRHPLSVDRWREVVLDHAETIVLRLLGGRGYWAYVLDQAAEAARDRGARLIVLPGDDRDDPGLDGWSTVAESERRALWAYLREGGVRNAEALLARLAGEPAGEPEPLPRAGLLRPTSLDALDERPRALVVVYRALVQAGTLGPVDALADALAARGLQPVVVWVASLKERPCAGFVTGVLRAVRPDVVLSATGFTVGEDDPLASADAPVLQVVLSGGDETAWDAGRHGLSPSDLAMSVVLPEIDGRVLARAVAFKATARFDELTECPIVEPVPRADRIAFTADLARAWVSLRATPPAERRVALVLANYPIRDGRIANGVGLDTPASTVAILATLRAAGYRIEGAPADGAGLIADLLAGVTNDPASLQRAGLAVDLPLATYRDALGALPEAVRTAVEQRWGAPESDPFCRDGALVLPVVRYGSVVVALQPSRGYDIDPERTWHDPDLVPPHRYLALYAWLRSTFRAHAIVQVGKHGTLEWLPGKSVALSAACLPEAVLGPVPLLYPFIVNDPGEGAAAKRRAAAVIVDHLTPPLTRAELYGPLREVEALLDEYAQASALDPKRAARLRRAVIERAASLGLDRDLGLPEGPQDDTLLPALDRHLCDLKELQIRDGLHVLGTAPAGRQRTDLLVALARVPRGRGDGRDASLIRALAADLGLGGFDPLTADPAETWTGPTPPRLAELDPGPWRTAGDTRERLELLAAALVDGSATPEPAWAGAAAVLDEITERLAPALARSATDELGHLLAGLDGRRVPPGPSGAPTRGRPDVLPTGRNFHGVDSRAVPTPTAWQLGWRSAALVVEHHRQTHGEWPRRLALTVWGTATMRTGGDDIAQALAFLGCRPVWDAASGRVTGVELLPAAVLGRPRIDVTLRVSGLFRDAFPAQIELVDDAVRAVAALDEPEDVNPLAAAVREEAHALESAGLEPRLALRRASYRVFGSKPGAYGAGLQALIDSSAWRDEGDLADAFLAWGGWAYGRGVAGEAARDGLARRLGSTELVVHNQDNREHDLLDSDDYYQFEGGLAAAVRVLSGRQPETVHLDHALPERPVLRTLRQEIARIVRGRAANPKWLAGVMRHGHKGAFEIAATVDYLFAFAATARVVEDHHFDQLFDAYLQDERVRAFLADANPAALAEIAERFTEPCVEVSGTPPRNSAVALLDDLAAGRAAR